MSSGNAHPTSIDEALDAAVAEDAPKGRLEDAEIQRLVELSRDASYQRSDRVPVKTVEAFEPRSLVSIAMAAQRRREAEMQTAVAAGAVVEDEAGQAGDMPVDAAPDAMQEGDAAVPAEGEAVETGMEAADAADGQDETAGDGDDGDQAPDGETGLEASSTSQEDFEAGRKEGLEEGRRVGFDEGKAEGIEEGRAAGRAEASAQLERAIQAFEAASARLKDLTAVDSDALSAHINRSILELASERAGRAITDQPDSFADRIEELLGTIRTVSGQPAIRLNPGDLSSIQPLVEAREKLRHCTFVADPALASGDLSVTVGTIGIDDIILPEISGDSPVPDLAAAVSAETTEADAPAADTATDTAAGTAGDDAEATDG